jgi:hypothetical protein
MMAMSYGSSAPAMPSIGEARTGNGEETFEGVLITVAAASISPSMREIKLFQSLLGPIQIRALRGLAPTMTPVGALLKAKPLWVERTELK